MKTGKPTSAGRFFRAAAALCLAIGMCTVAHAATYHVDDSAPGGGNGLSWPQAFNNLQIALGAADQSGGADLVKVAQGTYKPGPAGQRLESFVLPLDLTLLGGYIGWDDPVDPDVRNPDLYVTILSGDIDSNDVNSPADHWTDIVGGNSLHVITVINPLGQHDPVTDSIEVDGFVITAGDADGEDDQGIGGGAYLDNLDIPNFQPAPSFRKCTFTGNRSNEGGGGLAALFMGVSLRDCLFRFNQTTDEAPFQLNGGGGISVLGPLTLVTSQFIGNEAVDLGGGVESIVGGVIVDCTFLNNVAGTRGGGVWASGVALTNCLFAGNFAHEGFRFARCRHPCLVGSHVGKADLSQGSPKRGRAGERVAVGGLAQLWIGVCWTGTKVLDQLAVVEAVHIAVAVEVGRAVSRQRWTQARESSGSKQDRLVGLIHTTVAVEVPRTQIGDMLVYPHVDPFSSIVVAVLNAVVQVEIRRGLPVVGVIVNIKLITRDQAWDTALRLTAIQRVAGINARRTR